MGIYERDFTVRYCDVNENNVLSFTGLMNLLQEIAGMHSSEVGYGINNIPKTGLTWFLLYWKIKIYTNPKWNTKLHIKTWARKLDKACSFRDFEVYNENNNKMAIATSKWALLDVNKNSISRIPSNMNEQYGIVEKCVFDEPINTKIEIPTESTFVYEYTTQRRDIDTNHHVNNLYYLDYAFQALPDEIYYNTNFTDIEISYKKQLKINEKINCFYSNEDNTHIVTIKNYNSTCVHAIIKIK